MVQVEKQVKVVKLIYPVISVLRYRKALVILWIFSTLSCSAIYCYDSKEQQKLL